MDKKNLIKHYPIDDMAVVWQPSKCQHSGVCVKGLPEVFRSGKQPWIEVSGSDAETIRAQVAKCPSGALSIKEQ